MVNRPVEQPVYPGQQLRVSVSSCGRAEVAERIVLAGRTMRPAEYEPYIDHARRTVLLVMAGLVVLVVTSTAWVVRSVR